MVYLVHYKLGKGNWYSTELPADEIEIIEYRPVNRRKQREVAYILPVQTVEAHSLFAKHDHAKPLADFLIARGSLFGGFRRHSRRDQLSH